MIAPTTGPTHFEPIVAHAPSPGVCLGAALARYRVPLGPTINRPQLPRSNNSTPGVLLKLAKNPLLGPLAALLFVLPVIGGCTNDSLPSESETVVRPRPTAKDVLPRLTKDGSGKGAYETTVRCTDGSQETIQLPESAGKDLTTYQNLRGARVAESCTRSQ